MSRVRLVRAPWLVLAFWLVTLAGCASAPLSTAPVRSATNVPPAPVVEPAPAPVQPAAGESPADTPAEVQAEVVVTPLGQAPDGVAPEPQITPQIALLLPLKSRDFSRAAEMVRAGFEAAAALQTDKTLPVKVYPIDNETDALLAAYQQATAAGARCIVAGLTRDGAAAIAVSGSVTVPTLVLNQVEPAQIPAAPFYMLSLSLDGEARQVARLIASQRLHRVAVLAGPSPLSKRIRDAFEQAWTAQGGEIATRLEIGRDAAQYPKLRAALQTADSIFIAAEPALLRQVRPYIAGSAPTFTTSQAYDGKSNPGANVDLQDLRFLDMPWIVDPAQPAVALYPRAARLVSADLDRLYALGIDAYRLSLLLATDNKAGIQSLNGVTGRITLSDGHQFQRELVPAYFDNGQPVLLNPPAQ